MASLRYHVYGDHEPASQSYPRQLIQDGRPSVEARKYLGLGSRGPNTIISLLWLELTDLSQWQTDQLPTSLCQMYDGQVGDSTAEAPRDHNFAFIDRCPVPADSEYNTEQASFPLLRISRIMKSVPHSLRRKRRKAFTKHELQRHEKKLIRRIHQKKKLIAKKESHVI